MDGCWRWVWGFLYSSLVVNEHIRSVLAASLSNYLNDSGFHQPPSVVGTSPYRATCQSLIQTSQENGIAGTLATPPPNPRPLLQSAIDLGTALSDP
jgi:hypothetical protein